MVIHLLQAFTNVIFRTAVQYAAGVKISTDIVHYMVPLR